MLAGMQAGFKQFQAWSPKWWAMQEAHGQCCVLFLVDRKSRLPPGAPGPSNRGGETSSLPRCTAQQCWHV